MIDFNTIINQTIQTAIATAVEQALSKQSKLIVEMQEQIEQMQLTIDQMQNEMISEDQITNFVESAIDEHANDTEFEFDIDTFLMSDEFDEAVREVIRNRI